MRRVRWFAGALLPAFAVLSATAGAANDPVVTAATQVTADLNPVRAHSTPQIVRNPRTGELVITESDPRSPTRSCAVYLSADGGAAGSRAATPW